MIRAVAIRILRQVLLVILLGLKDYRRGDYFWNGQSGSRFGVPNLRRYAPDDLPTSGRSASHKR